MAEKRKLLRIKNDFQQKLILQTLMSTFIGINVIIIYLFLGPLSKVDTPDMLIAVVVVIMEVVTMVVVYRFSLVASHRIAGPVFVFERALKRMAEGDLTQQVSLREHDNFHESADVFNATIGELRTRILKLRGLIDKVQGDLAAEQGDPRLVEISEALRD
ncbi:MAG TPA: hypothetical protein VIW02_02185, partial [Gammaproteobacteria bacterium]